MADSVTNWNVQPQNRSQVQISDNNSDDDVLFDPQYAPIDPSLCKNPNDNKSSPNNPRNGLSNRASIRRQNGITGRKRNRNEFQDDQNQDQSLPNGQPPPKRAKTPQLIHEDEDDDLLSPRHHNQNHNRKHNASNIHTKSLLSQSGMLL